jgi:hypothetical protein
MEKTNDCLSKTSKARSVVDLCQGEMERKPQTKNGNSVSPIEQYKHDYLHVAFYI